MFKKTILLILSVLHFSVSFSAVAEVYKHVDETGIVTYTNAPIKGAIKLNLGPEPSARPAKPKHLEFPNKEKLAHPASQNAQKAIDTLQAINYKIEVGTSYVEYGKMLSDASVPVKTFLNSQEAKDNAIISARIEDIWNHYLCALDVWRLKFEGRTFVTNDIELIKLKFPHVEIKTDPFNVTSYEIASILQQIWEKIPQKLKELKTPTNVDVKTIINPFGWPSEVLAAENEVYTFCLMPIIKASKKSYNDSSRDSSKHIEVLKTAFSSCIESNSNKINELKNAATKGKATKYIANLFSDPESAQFRNVYVKDGGFVVCGEVNAKDLHGEYMGFNRFYYLELIHTNDAITYIEHQNPGSLQDLKASYMISELCPNLISRPENAPDENPQQDGKPAKPSHPQKPPSPKKRLNHPT